MHSNISVELVTFFDNRVCSCIHNFLFCFCLLRNKLLVELLCDKNLWSRQK